MVSTRAFAVLGLCLAAGLFIFGRQIGEAVKTGRGFDRYFTVRGLSEREAKATLVIWPIKVKVDAPDLAELTAKMDAAKSTVLDYLKSSGVSSEDVRFGLPKITDRMDYRAYAENPHLPRYEALITLVVRSQDVDTVKKSIQGSDALISKGLPLAGNDYGEHVEFVFDKVNELKPAMIQEATANARLAAEKFAADSKARVGAIRKATQGVVEIEDRDAATPELKVVRVVTTVEFFIE